MAAGVEERLIRSIRRPKVCVVKDVEELSTELHIERLRDSGDVVVLEYGDIQILQSWTYDAIPAGVSPQRCRIGKRETAQVHIVEPLLLVVSIHDIATWHTIWEIPGVSTIQAQGIAADQWSERHAVAQLEDATELPSVRGPGERARHPPVGHSPNAVRHEHFPNIEVGWSPA